jgi:hypothetical protein
MRGTILNRAVQCIHHLAENEARNIEKWALEKLLTGTDEVYMKSLFLVSFHHSALKVSEERGCNNDDERPWKRKNVQWTVAWVALRGFSLFSCSIHSRTWVLFYSEFWR